MRHPLDAARPARDGSEEGHPQQVQRTRPGSPELRELIDGALASAAHELRTPLAVVRAHAQLMRRGTSVADASAATILRQVDRLSFLVQQWIEFVRLRTAPARVAAVPFELGRVLRSAVERARLSHPGREVRVGPCPAAPVVGDGERIEHALLHLLDSALRTAAPGTAVDVRLSESVPGFTVCVGDPGASVPRGRPGREDGALGLGLHVCEHIVRSHGGTLWVAQHGDGRGSTASVFLPRGCDPAGERRACEVLVIEDDPDLLEVVELVLGESGFQVRTARDGEEGLTRAAEELPGLIFLDMQMPRMDGWAFAREFHVRYGRWCPIVVMTAAESAAARARDIGAEAWLAKPFDLDEVVRHARRFLPAPAPGAA